MTMRLRVLLPTSVLIDRQGRVRLVSQGFAPSEMQRFEDLVKRLLLEEPDGTSAK